MEKLIEILNNVRDDVDYETCDTLIDDGIYVSFDIISLVAALCEEYDVEIGAEELIPENFNSAKALYEMVQRLIEEQN
ncbi:MAG: acyl carrier protein [Oscillospiraceae bacterium]|jgi:acyl carrier protein|nr:acyl carrier protein [Oscillospiraceae bacterium]